MAVYFRRFEEYLESDRGKAAADFKTLQGEEYLKNRLFSAFNAGRMTGSAEQMLIENKALEIAKAEIQFLKSKLEDTLLREYSLSKQLKAKKKLEK